MLVFPLVWAKRPYCNLSKFLFVCGLSGQIFKTNRFTFHHSYFTGRLPLFLYASVSRLVMNDLKTWLSVDFLQSNLHVGLNSSRMLIFFVFISLGQCCTSRFSRYLIQDLLSLECTNFTYGMAALYSKAQSQSRIDNGSLSKCMYPFDLILTFPVAWSGVTVLEL